MKINIARIKKKLEIKNSEKNFLEVNFQEGNFIGGNFPGRNFPGLIFLAINLLGGCF